jgi:hydroxyacyl-ACP dehydratase HTD2-like protein with hotdog domain
MIAIRLATRDGHEAANVMIPPFQYLPEVLVWGKGIFSFHAELNMDGEPNKAEYREVFCFVIPPMTPQLKGQNADR